MAFNISTTPDTTATEAHLYSYSPAIADGTLSSWDLRGAPTGMTFDSSTGVIHWTPSYDKTSSGDLRLYAFSTADETATQDWTVAVHFVSPVITNTPRTDATEHVLYNYTPTATVVDFSHYDFTSTLEDNVTFDSTTGIFTWLPNYDQSNSGPISIRLWSLNGLSAHVDWSISVTLISPAITNTPGKTAVEGSLYSFLPTYTAQDLNNWSLTGAPVGMTLDTTTGLINWTPNYNQTNSGSLSLTIHDLNGLSAHVDWTVASTLVAPVITSTPDTTAFINVDYIYTPTKTAVHFNHWSLSGSIPSGVHFDPSSGAISWTPDEDQTSAGPLVLRALSLNGLYADQTFSLIVLPEPKTLFAEQSGISTVGPTGLRYTIKNAWVLNAENNLPVGTNLEIGF